MSTEQLAEVALFAKDLAAAVALIEVIAAHPNFAGPSAPHVALREGAETLAIRMSELQEVIRAAATAPAALGPIQ